MKEQTINNEDSKIKEMIDELVKKLKKHLKNI